jgi:hypothetical protein
MRPKPRYTRLLSELVGATCNVVIFVLDYVQIGFAGLSAISFIGIISVSRDGIESTFPEPGSRDALCSLIGSTVESAEFWGEYWMQIRFTDGAIFTVDEDPRHPDWEAWDWQGAPTTLRWDGCKWPGHPRVR